MHILVSKRGLTSVIDTVLDLEVLAAMDPHIIDIEDRDSSYDIRCLRTSDVCKPYEKVFNVYVRPTSEVGAYDWAEVGLYYTNNYTSTLLLSRSSQKLTENVIRSRVYVDAKDLDEDRMVKLDSLHPLVYQGGVAVSPYSDDYDECMLWSCAGTQRLQSD